MNYHVYTASHGENGKITHFIIDEIGMLKKKEEYPAPCPDYLCLKDGLLYVLLREPYCGQSGVAVYKVNPDGSLSLKERPQPTRGSIASYVLRHNGNTYVTNYIQGTTIKLPETMLVHTGSSIHPFRQLCSHPHCITPIPRTEYLCIVDLGTDKVYITDLNLVLLSETVFPSGSGPRHIAFSSDGRTAYCITELSSQIFVLKCEGNKLTIISNYPALPSDCSIASTASGLRISPDERYVLATNRGHDSICIYSASGIYLADPAWISSSGKSPREIYFAGDFLLCGNENSDTLVSFSFCSGTLVKIATVPVSCPWSITACPEDFCFLKTTSSPHLHS